jgi:hypothetical protein
MRYNVDELIDQLEGIKDQYGGEAEIRIAFQPSWPLRGTIASVQHGMDLEFCDEDGYLRQEDPNDEAPEVRQYVWIAIDQVGGHSEHPYAPREAWQS